MALYNYKRYKIADGIITSTISNSNPYAYESSSNYVNRMTSFGGKTGITYVTGKGYITTGSSESYYLYDNTILNVPAGKRLYAISNSYTHPDDGISYGLTAIRRSIYEYYYNTEGVVEEVGVYYEFDSCSYDTTPIKGAYIDTIQAEDGTYPNNGISGNYWYVKDTAVFTPPDLKIRVNGQLETYSDGWVRVNGQLRKIDLIWIRVNGVLKKI